jgi:hypothetical protein
MAARNRRRRPTGYTRRQSLHEHGWTLIQAFPVGQTLDVNQNVYNP